MGTESPEALLNQWKTDSLPIERGMGQLLQHLVKLTTTLTQVERQQTVMQQSIAGQSVSWTNLKTEVDDLRTQVRLLQSEMRRLLKHAGLAPQKPPKRRQKG